MSAWLIYSMMGIYPISPASPIYTVTAPVFDKITIQLDNRYYKNKQLVIEKKGTGKIKRLKLNHKTYNSYFINHNDLVKEGHLEFLLK